MNSKNILLPIEELNNAIARYSSSHIDSRWKGYFEPLIHFSIGLPVPLIGAMILIWQMRPNDLQNIFPLDTMESRFDFLCWCIFQGREEYAILKDADSLWDELNSPAYNPIDFTESDSALSISKLMLCVHRARTDLDVDLDAENGRARFAAWYFQNGANEMGLNFLDPPEWQLKYLNRPYKSLEINTLQAIIYLSRTDLQSEFSLPRDKENYINWFKDQITLPVKKITVKRPLDLMSREFGVNVIGHARGELGIGEDCRMAARALEQAAIGVRIVDFDPGIHVPQGDSSCEALVDNRVAYNVNLFCLPAQEHARCFAVKGIELFEGCYNIGYWPWELPNWPDAWAHLFALADEVWSSTNFIRNSLLTSTGIKPKLQLMPMAVELPKSNNLSREKFGLPNATTLFLFVFDLNSSAYRKNPNACIEAFELAFPRNSRNENPAVALVIKAHKPKENNKEWSMLKKLVSEDSRVYLIEDTLSKRDLISLYNVCDVFISLHRSEGFGRCIAEAMLLGKPVITTAFSGNMEFTDSENSMLVGFNLGQVQEGQYTENKNQTWAIPDVLAAANYMKSLAKSKILREKIGKKAAKTIKKNHCLSSIGNSYKDHLTGIFEELMAKKTLPVPDTIIHNTKIYIKLGHAQSYELKISVTNGKTICAIKETPLDIKKVWHIDDEEISILQRCQQFDLDVDRRYLAETLWLVYHVAKNGAMIRNSSEFIDSYFAATGYYFEKIKKLDRTTLKVIKEYEHKNFDGISFCIPTSGDTPELRKCVKRILELDINKEILLCGKVAESFPYLDQVRIVGEDIPFPPVWITKKKNVAVELARYSTVAVLHDRVLLPVNFTEIFSNSLPIPVIGIGGMFSLSRDFNLIGRYSDFNVLNQRDALPKFSYMSELVPGEISDFSLDSSLMMARSASFLYYTNHKNDSYQKYATGSFYLTTKSIHDQIPLNERLFWEDFEDVEWGTRCERLGIPHVFNSDYYQMTLAVRSMVLPPHHYQDDDGVISPVIPPWLDAISTGASKPDLAQIITAEKLLSNFERFIDQRSLDKRLIISFEAAYFKRDIEDIVGLIINAIRFATQGIKTFDEPLIKSVEGLISATLERTNLGDMRCHAEHFNTGFDLWERISTNYGFTRWLGFIKIPGMLRFAEESSELESSEVSDADLFNSCLNNYEYLNKIFGHRESPKYWFNVIKNFNWSF